MDNRAQVAPANAARLKIPVLGRRGIHHLIAVCFQSLHADAATVHSDIHRACGADRCSALCFFLRHFLPARREPLQIRFNEPKNFLPMNRRPMPNTSIAFRGLCFGVHLLAYPIFYFFSQGGEWWIYRHILHIGAMLVNFAQQLVKRDSFHPET